jgi:hypothetical protein
MFKASKQKSRTLEQQNSLLVQIVSMLTQIQFTARDEASTLPEELGALQDLDDKTAQESLQLLNTINAKLKTAKEDGNRVQTNLKTQLGAAPLDGNESSPATRTFHSQANDVAEEPPSYRALANTESKTAHPKSFSITSAQSSLNEQCQDHLVLVSPLHSLEL